MSELLKRDELDSVKGITKQIIDKGIETILEKQEKVIDTFVENKKDCIFALASSTQPAPF